MSALPSQPGSPRGSRCPTPRPVFDTEVAKRVYTILRNFASQIFVVVFAVIFALFYGMKGTTFLSFLIKIGFTVVVFYVLMFLFVDNGGRYIAETFAVALVVIFVVYFLIHSSVGEFMAAVVVAAFLATVSRFLN